MIDIILIEHYMDKKIKQQIDECLIGIKKRQIGSVEQLYFLISPTIRYIALKYLKHEECADDLVQDFWADIFRIADKYYYLCNGFSYLCKIMTRKAINRYNKINKDKAKVHFVDYSNMENCYCNLVIDTNNIELKVEVEKSFKELNDKERIIIQQTYFEGKTVRQIAKELHISKSEVSRIKMLAIKKMKEILEKAEVDKIIM